MAGRRRRSRRASGQISENLKCVFAFIYCPRRGLPRSSATLLIDLVCVCVCVCLCVRDLAEIYRRASAPASNADTFGVLPRGFGEGPEKKTLRHAIKTFPGPVFLATFSLFEQKISACSGGHQSSIEMQLFLANFAKGLALNVGLESWHST